MSLTKPLRLSAAAFLSIACLAFSSSQTASAQMFGPRTLGQPLTRQDPPRALDPTGMEAGALTGSERFLRANRSDTDFVGVDRAETNTFIGAGQVIEAGRVQSAIESLQTPPDRSRQMNQVWAPAPARSPYAPRLELKFSYGSPNRFWRQHPPRINSFQWDYDFASQLNLISPNWIAQDEASQESETTASSNLMNEQFNLDLSKRIRRSGDDSLEVFLKGKTAILRGSVSQPKQKELAELLIGFEPGISKVQNEIVVENF